MLYKTGAKCRLIVDERVIHHTNCCLAAVFLPWLPGRHRSDLTVVALVVTEEEPLETRVVEATVPRHVRVFTVRSARTVPPITARRRRVTDAETGTQIVRY